MDENGSKANVYCSNKILRHNIMVAIGICSNYIVRKKKFLKFYPDPRNLVTYMLTNAFIWNHMMAMILEDVSNMSHLLCSFSRISFRSNSSSSSSSMNSPKNNNLLNEQDNQTFSSKRLCFGATSCVWLSCSLSKLLFLGEFIEEEDEDTRG